MSHITRFEFEQMWQRLRPKRTGQEPVGEPVGHERDLHDQIAAWCKQRGLFYVHSRMDKPTHYSLGTPDFIIACPSGLTLWIECKAKGGKQTPTQAGVAMMLERTGHRFRLVHSMKEFLASAEIND